MKFITDDVKVCCLPCCLPVNFFLKLCQSIATYQLSNDGLNRTCYKSLISSSKSGTLFTLYKQSDRHLNIKYIDIHYMTYTQLNYHKLETPPLKTKKSPARHICD